MTNPNHCLLVKFLFYFSAERESLQYRIRCLESQVTNLESLIEEIDNKNNAEESAAAANRIGQAVSEQSTTPQDQPFPQQNQNVLPNASSLFGGVPSMQTANDNAFDSFQPNPIHHQQSQSVR